LGNSLKAYVKDFDSPYEAIQKMKIMLMSVKSRLKSIIDHFIEDMFLSMSG
jgi:hypothetical protein